MPVRASDTASASVIRGWPGCTSSGGVASDTTIKRGFEAVYTGGSATNAQIFSAGTLELHSGAVLQGAGGMWFYSAAYLRTLKGLIEAGDWESVTRPPR